MPEGRRRSGLAAGVEALFAEDFVGRVLPSDQRAALPPDGYVVAVAAERR